MSTSSNRRIGLGVIRIVRIAVIVALIMSCGDMGCPPEEILNAPISSNLVDTTEPPPGDVLTSFNSFIINFLKPIDQNTFDIYEDVKSTCQRGDLPPVDITLFEEIDLLASTPERFVLNVRQEWWENVEVGDIIRVSILGSDEIGNSAITSIADNPPGTSAVRLARTVTVRFTKADPNAGDPGAPPIITTYPSGLVSLETGVPDPDAPGDAQDQPPFVEPHDRMLFRFSEPMASISLLGEISQQSPRFPGTSAGMDFRSFKGIKEFESEGRNHTGVVRNGFFTMALGAVYELNILGEDIEDPRYPATQDFSGQALASSESYYFRTSHVSIFVPFQAPYIDSNLEGDIFIQAGVMGFKVTEHVAAVVPESGVYFSDVLIWEAEDPENPGAYDVQLVPDGSGKLCVTAFSWTGENLGSDCIRVYEEQRLETTADNSPIVGPEGAIIRLGNFHVQFFESGLQHEIDGVTYEIEPSLGEAIEIRLQREPNYPDDRMSLNDRYEVKIPDSVELVMNAFVWLEFDPNNPNINDIENPGRFDFWLFLNDISDYKLCKAQNYDFGGLETESCYAYSDQTHLPFAIGAEVDSFSWMGGSPTHSSPFNEGDCAATVIQEKKCCPDSNYYVDENGPGWCTCVGGNQDGTGCGLLCATSCWATSLMRCPTGFVCDYDRDCGEWDPFGDCNCVPGGGSTECTGDDFPAIFEAERRRCFDCPVDDCEDYNNAINDDEPDDNKKPVGSYKGKCDLVPLDPLECYDGGQGQQCYGPVRYGGKYTCAISLPEWKDPPSQTCQDNWNQFKEQANNHEQEHCEIGQRNCNTAAQRAEHVQACIGSHSTVEENCAAAIFSYNTTITILKGTQGHRRNAEQKKYDEESGDAPAPDCNCN